MVFTKMDKRVNSQSVVELLVASKSKRSPPSQQAVDLNENNNNESYLSSVGDSADSASNVHVCAGVDSSPTGSGRANSARKSAGMVDDRKTAMPAMMLAPLIEPSIVPTLEHERKGAYQLVSDKTLQYKTAGAKVSQSVSAAEAELAHSQIGSEGGLTLSLPMQAPPKD